MASLKVGSVAPSFTSLDQNGNAVSLSDFIGKKVVLYFYPKDNTPTCTTESCNLNDNYNLFLKNGYVVLGVSADDVKSHKKFADKYKLKFQLLADTEKKIIKKYKAWGPKVLFGVHYDGILRKTYIIDAQGKIEEVIEDVVSKKHSEQILKLKS